MSEAYARAMTAAMEKMMRDMHAASHSGEDILAGQTTEIAAMRGRLALLRGEARLEGEPYPELGGTRGAVR